MIDMKYRPNPWALPAGDVLPVPTIDEVLDWAALFEESNSEDEGTTGDEFRHFDPHWGLYSLLAAVKEIHTLRQENSKLKMNQSRTGW